MMKLISAIIKPFKLEEVRQALLNFGVEEVIRIRTDERGNEAI